ncbi:MAG: hypothetical protein KDD19_21385 [Phaeodactylibacter sp.]|nr:hypothetical protein [Phaeodactylibacter sp.]MCB9049830.1 hypothetical protein [Lewinellaceae bacterium]
MKLHPFFPLALLLCLWVSASAQRTEKWVRKKELPHYTEGTFSLNVSSVMEIVSLISTVESYTFGKGQNLYFDYYVPEESPYFLRMGEKRLLSYYVLESKPGSTPAGWNTFGPCEVDGLLRELKVTPENIGALLRINGDNSKYFLPVSVQTNQDPSEVESYKAVFRLSRSILGGEYKIYKGEHKGIAPESCLLDSGAIGKHSARSTFQLEAKTDTLKEYEGWITVDLSLVPRGSTRPAPFRFFFYHKEKPTRQ